jgi:hypothetical protein
MEVWLLLIAALSALEVRLNDRPEKYKHMAYSIMPSGVLLLICICVVLIADREEGPIRI